nr:hypothetical protein [Tanacetum cinerariifolium]
MVCVIKHIPVVSIVGMGQTMNGRTYRCVLCYRLGVPLFSVLKLCSACVPGSLRELEKDAMTLLERIRRFSVTQDIEARAAVHIFNRIGFAFARGVGT